MIFFNNAGILLIFIISLFVILLAIIFAVLLFLKFKFKKSYKPKKNYFNKENKPLLLGHRGIMSIDIENSFSSFRLIKEFELDGTELDANLTKDNKLIVFHDFSIKRLFGVNKNINELTYSQIEKFKLISFDNRLENIPLLEDVLNFLKDCKLINIEIKSNTLFSNGIEKKLYELITKLKIEDKIVVSSFNPFSLYRFKKIANYIPRGLLLSKKDVPIYIKKMWFLEFAQPDFIHFHADYLDDIIVNKFDKKGYGIVFWGIDNINLLKRALGYKPIFIISNIPHILKKYI